MSNKVITDLELKLKYGREEHLPHHVCVRNSRNMILLYALWIEVSQYRQKSTNFENEQKRRFVSSPSMIEEV